MANTHAHVRRRAARRLATAVAAPATQVVTHLCYSDFGDIMGPIIDMDGAARGGGYSGCATVARRPGSYSGRSRRTHPRSHTRKPIHSLTHNAQTHAPPSRRADD